MMKKQIIVSTLTCVLALSGSFSLAVGQDRAQTKDQAPIYGSQLMTEQERNEHREKIRAAKTAKERERIRHEHHQLMMERAKKQGVTLPDEPPAMGSRRGMGAGESMGPRGNMEPGGNTGGGRGR